MGFPQGCSVLLVFLGHGHVLEAFLGHFWGVIIIFRPFGNYFLDVFFGNFWAFLIFDGSFLGFSMVLLVILGSFLGPFSGEGPFDVFWKFV